MLIQLIARVCCTPVRWRTVNLSHFQNLFISHSVINLRVIMTRSLWESVWWSKEVQKCGWAINCLYWVYITFGRGQHHSMSSTRVYYLLWLQFNIDCLRLSGLCWVNTVTIRRVRMTEFWVTCYFQWSMNASDKTKHVWMVVYW